MLDKSKSLYERDEKGVLIPNEVLLEIDEKDTEQFKYKGEKVLVTPLPRGKLRRIFSEMSKVKDDDKDEKDFDGEIILEHCHDPKYTKDEIPFIKPALVTCIVNTVFRESGLKVGKSKKESIKDAEDEFGKN